MPRVSANIMDANTLSAFLRTMRNGDPAIFNGEYVLEDDFAAVTFQGTFGGVQNNFPTTGTITGLIFFDQRGPGFQIYDLNVSVAAFRQAVEANDIAALTALVFGGADTVTGTSEADILRGYGGNDTITGSNGTDTMYGDDGNDTLQGGLDNDTMYGGNGDDFILGMPGNDLIDGGNGNDTATFGNVLFNYVGVGANVSLLLQGQAQNTGYGIDTLVGIENIHGTSYNDTLRGDDNANRLFGLGQGNDQLFGEGGDDLLIMNFVGPAAGVQTYDGGAGIDTLRFITGGGGATFSLALGTRQTIGTGSLLAEGIENIEGSGGNDTLTGDSLANMISGAAGSDRLDGGAGADVLNGGSGDDILIGGAGADLLTGSTGIDTFVYRLAADTSAATGMDIIQDFQTGVDRIDLSAVDVQNLALVADGSLTRLQGIVGSETFTLVVNGAVAMSDLILAPAPSPSTVRNGTSGNDELIGGSGADLIAGGLGADRLTGGTGADTFRYLTIDDSTASALDIITDFQTGTDGIDISALNSYSASVIRFNGDSYIYAQTPNGFQFFTAAFGVVNGSDLAFTNNHGVYMIGSEQGETLIGSTNNDPLQGNGGNDVLIGGLGGDAISGGAGADIFLYRTAAESVAAGDRYDNLYDFESGIDQIDLSAIGTTSVSIIRSGGSSFVFSQTTSGVQLQLVAAGRDINGDDFVYGAGHGVFLTGSAGGDFLRGGVKADSLAGGDGNDTLIGGLSGDYLAGEGGADTYKYLSAAESAVADSDRIGSFQAGVDKLDLSAVRMGPNDVFNIVYSNGGSFIFVDLGGNGTNDMLIQATSVINRSDVTWDPPVGSAPTEGAESMSIGLRQSADLYRGTGVLADSGTPTAETDSQVDLDPADIGIDFERSEDVFILFMSQDQVHLSRPDLEAFELPALPLALLPGFTGEGMLTLSLLSHQNLETSTLCYRSHEPEGWIIQ